jgi:apolipoprotein D and lipocalin family protein
MKAALFFYILVLFSCASLSTHAQNADPSVVSSVDLNKYSGRWYEIARYPTFFQRNCERSTADYQVIDDKSISVYNVCYKKDGSTSDISGKATIVDPAVPAKLKVRFNIFAQGEYWIVALDENYQWAVVSSSNKESLFILARSAPMAAETLNPILEDLKNRGFDLSKIVYDKY